MYDYLSLECGRIGADMLHVVVADAMRDDIAIGGANLHDIAALEVSPAAGDPGLQ